jgi:hypothetical protein
MSATLGTKPKKYIPSPPLAEEREQGRGGTLWTYTITNPPYRQLRGMPVNTTWINNVHRDGCCYAQRTICRLQVLRGYKQAVRPRLPNCNERRPRNLMIGPQNRKPGQRWNGIGSPGTNCSERHRRASTRETILAPFQRINQLGEGRCAGRTDELESLCSNKIAPGSRSQCPAETSRCHQTLRPGRLEDPSLQGRILAAQHLGQLGNRIAAHAHDSRLCIVPPGDPLTIPGRAEINARGPRPLRQPLTQLLSLILRLPLPRPQKSRPNRTHDHRSGNN